MASIIGKTIKGQTYYYLREVAASVQEPGDQSWPSSMTNRSAQS